MADYEANFTLEPQTEVEADFSMSVINTEHNLLANRDLADQHPISAITGLQDALDTIPTDYVSDSELEVALLEKQDVLTAGANIQIVGNTISATDTKYTAGTGISIVGNVISNTQTSAEWGNITGTLSAQTDLQNALNLKANTADIPTATSDLTNDSGYITNAALVGYATESYVTTAVGTETTNRQNADNNLQSQIDAITASSDVTDIVGTYAELQSYDTSTLPPNSIIKVLQDESRNNETTYYRWIVTGGVGAWSLIGEEGPYYTISAADAKFATQTALSTGLATKQDIISDLSAIRTNATNGASAYTTIQSYGNIVTHNVSEFATPTYVDTELADKADNTNIINGAPLSNTSSYFYGTSDSAATDVEKVVSIPSITELNVGQVIIVQPSITSTVANSTLKLNNFTAYPMKYNGVAITTSTDSIVWSQLYPSAFIFDGDNWVFLCHGLDSNTTYVMNYSIDAGRYISGVGTYAITRYSLIMQKPDMTWEKITATNKTYTTATNKTVNTNGFILNQIKYYGTTTTLANGALTASNVVYQKATNVNLAYSLNCGTAPGWDIGDYIYLVGTIGADGLFYLDTTQWWSLSLPSTNDGKLYIRIGVALNSEDSTASFLDDRPIFYHNGTKICEYKVADNKQDISNLVTSISSSSTDAQYPSAKCVYDIVGDIETLINAL